MVTRPTKDIIAHIAELERQLGVPASFLHPATIPSPTEQEKTSQRLLRERVKLDSAHETAPIQSARLCFLENALDTRRTVRAHHRGQLTVYLRLLGEKVPVIYGPYAEEDR